MSDTPSSWQMNQMIMMMESNASMKKNWFTKIRKKNNFHEIYKIDSYIQENNAVKSKFLKKKFHCNQMKKK